MNKGRFIVLEGIDCSGKSTHAHALVQYCKSIGVPAQLYSFPYRFSPTGRIISDHLRGKNADDFPVKCDNRTLHLLFSANRWEMQESMRKTLEQGTTIICDRYTYSGLLYGLARGLPEDWCRGCDEGLIEPDLVIWLDVSPSLAATRTRDKGAERDENIEFQERLYEIHKTRMDIHPHNMIEAPGSTMEEVQKSLRNYLF